MGRRQLSGRVSDCCWSAEASKGRWAGAGADPGDVPIQRLCAPHTTAVQPLLPLSPPLPLPLPRPPRNELYSDELDFKPFDDFFERDNKDDNGQGFVDTWGDALAKYASDELFNPNGT